jgi:serine/threonine protein kinase
MSVNSFSVGEYIQNRYLVLDKFSGSMGLAYLVEDLQHTANIDTPPQMIAKTLHPALDKTSLFDQFLEEASVWINITPKKNVVHAYKVESIDGIPFVFAEFIRRGILPNTLAEWIHYRLIPVEVGLYFAVQLLDGLWYMYQDNVEFHGDLKPSNILINEDFIVKINDWGFARSIRKPMMPKEAEWYARYHGSSAYIAPEAMTSPPYITRALDGFAVGVLLGEMLTGEKFPAGTAKKAVAAKLSNTCFGLQKSIISSLSHIVAELLTSDANKRINFYENYAREIAEIFIDVTGINVIDDRDAIIIEALPSGHRDRVRKSKTTIQRLRNSSQIEDEEA